MENKKIDARAEKARMLVALLGAEFTKGSKHPFFKQVSQQAVSSEQPSETSLEMSTALSALIKTLQQNDPALGSETAFAKTEKPAALPDLKEQAPTKSGSTTDLSHSDRELAAQHPAVIAQQIQALSQSDQRNFLKALPKSIARQVTLYSLRLKAPRA